MVKTIFYVLFSLKIFPRTAGVRSPILAATYAYLTEATGLLADISAILADILLDIVHDMLKEGTVMNQIYNMLPPATQTTIQTINQLPLDFVTIFLNGVLVEQVNVTAIISKPGVSIVCYKTQTNKR